MVADSRRRIERRHQREDCRAGNVAGSGSLPFAACYAGSHSLARKNPQTAENDHRKCVSFGILRSRGEVSTRSPSTGLLLNMRKIRVDSDNKRLARCTNTALTQSRKVK